MIRKQLIKSVPIALRAELNGKDVVFNFTFLGANFAKFKLSYNLFVGLRNIIEDIYQSSLKSYTSQQQELGGTPSVHTGLVDKGAIGSVSDRIHKIDNGVIL